MGLFDQDVGSQLNTDTSAVNTAPPANEAEYQQRYTGWQKFFENLKSNPTLQNVLIKLGGDLAQPIQYGQTPLGHFGRALQSSVDYMSATNELRRKAAMEAHAAELKDAENARQEREQTNRDRLSPANVAQVQANTQSTSEATRRANALEPTQLGVAKKNLEKLNLEYYNLQSRYLAGLLGPVEHLRLRDLETEKANAYNDMLRAHAEAYRAAAQKNGESGKPGNRPIVTKLNDDTVITTQMINGQMYQSITTLPKASDPEMAQEMAKKKVDKGTHWFSKNDYQGTAEEEQARLAAAYGKPSVQHFQVGADGSLTQVPGLPQNGLSGQVPGAPHFAGFKGDYDTLVEQIATNPNLSDEDRTRALTQLRNQRDADNKASQKPGVSTSRASAAPQNSGPIDVVRGPDGKLMRKGPGTPAAPAQPAAAASVAPSTSPANPMKYLEELDVLIRREALLAAQATNQVTRLQHEQRRDAFMRQRVQTKEKLGL